MEEMIQKFVDVCSSYGFGFGYGSSSSSGDGSGYGSGYGDGYGAGSSSGSGYGDGSSSGDGSGYGSGYGDGSSSSSGYGDGSGDGSGYGSGYGDGYGAGSSSGSGYGDGSSSGFGFGDGYGLFNAVINSHKIYNIDRTPTIIYRVFKNYAKGAIVNSDLTLTPCFIAKYKNIFAHGETLHKAQEALNQKLLQSMPIEERIKVFQDKFKPRASYPIRAFYEWHNTLTGSCEMGRSQFAKEHCIDLEGAMTVEEFILLTENAYGGEIIKLLKPYYFEEDKP